MGPETDPRRLAPHAVDDGAERLGLLEALRAADEMVTLHAARDLDCFVVSRVVGLDAARGTIDFEFKTDDAREAAFRRADRLVGVAFPGGVKLQFELARFTIVDLPDPARLRAHLPERAWRIQRRDAYRVTPPPHGLARLHLPDGEAAREVAVVDVSATGLAYLARSADAPEVGARMAGALLGLPACAPIRCVLHVRDVAPAFGEDRATLRVGCELEGLDPPAMRAVQVYVNAAQVRARRARPRIG
jgi:c-di-GMP-binding flagellar brake protein YcgR